MFTVSVSYTLGGEDVQIRITPVKRIVTWHFPLGYSPHFNAKRTCEMPPAYVCRLWKAWYCWIEYKIKNTLALVKSWAGLRSSLWLMVNPLAIVVFRYSSIIYLVSYKSLLLQALLFITCPKARDRTGFYSQRHICILVSFQNGRKGVFKEKLLLVLLDKSPAGKMTLVQCEANVGNYFFDVATRLIWRCESHQL